MSRLELAEIVIKLANLTMAEMTEFWPSLEGKR